MVTIRSLVCCFVAVAIIGILAIAQNSSQQRPAGELARGCGRAGLFSGAVLNGRFRFFDRRAERVQSRREARAGC